MAQALWRLAYLDLRPELSRLVMAVPPGFRFVVDDAARTANADPWHPWKGPDDLTDLRVPGRLCWLQMDVPVLPPGLDEVGDARRWRSGTSTGALLRSWRVPSAGRLHAEVPEILKKHGMADMDVQAMAPGGQLCHAMLVAQAFDPVDRSEDRAAVTGSAAWLVDREGRPLDPFPDRQSVGFKPGRGFLDSVKEANDLGHHAMAQFMWNRIELEVAAMLLALQMVNGPGTRTRPGAWYASPWLGEAHRERGLPPVQHEQHQVVSVDPAGAVGPGAWPEVVETIRRDGRAADLEDLAQRTGAPYWAVSAAWAQDGRGQVRPDQDEREALLAERDRQEEERRVLAERQALEEARERRFLAWKARKEQSRRDRAAWFDRLRQEEPGEDLLPTRPAPVERPERRVEPEQAPPPAPAAREVRGLLPAPQDDPARPGPDHPWDDHGDLVHQGQEWRVVLARGQGGRSAAQDFMDELAASAPQDLSVLMRTLRRLADVPDGTIANERLFRCFKAPRHDFLLCEVKRHAGVAGHSRIFMTRVRSETRDGKVEKRMVLLGGFTKKTNETPQAEVDRAARVRDRWLGERLDLDRARQARTLA